LCFGGEEDEWKQAAKKEWGQLEIKKNKRKTPKKKRDSGIFWNLPGFESGIFWNLPGVQPGIFWNLLGFSSRIFWNVLESLAGIFWNLLGF
jgi:hypothetical protein